MDIRLATPADAPSIVALNEDVQKLHAAALPHLFKPPSPATFPLPEVMDLLANSANYFYLAEVEREPVGYIYAEIRDQPENSFRYAVRFIHIHHISIRPAYRQRGYGECLVRQVLALAQEKGLSRITLDVWSFNTPARDFFHKQGFEVYNQRLWMNLPVEEQAAPEELAAL